MFVFGPRLKGFVKFSEWIVVLKVVGGDGGTGSGGGEGGGL